MRKTILVISLLIFIACGVYLGVVLLPDTSIPKPKVQVIVLSNSSNFYQSQVEKRLSVYDKYHQLYEKNNDLIGWIKIDSTRIDYPVMQVDNNEFYLNHNFNKEKNRNGLPFVDYRCDLENSNTNIMVYGHNMINGTMFSDLLKFDNPSFCEKNSIIKFDTLKEEREYQIFSSFYTQIYSEDQDVFKYYEFLGSNEELIFNEYIKNVKQLSIFKSDIQVKFGDELITLSTCGGKKDVGRFVVVAKRIR